MRYLKRIDFLNRGICLKSAWSKRKFRNEKLVSMFIFKEQTRNVCKNCANRKNMAWFSMLAVLNALEVKIDQAQEGLEDLIRKEQDVNGLLHPRMGKSNHLLIRSHRITRIL